MFIPLTSTGGSRETATETELETEDGQRVRHLSSTSRARFYQGSFRKEIFASPFEKVGELVNVRYTDPLQESSWKPNSSLSSTTSTGSAGEARMTARVSCVRPPLDPTQVAWMELASFLYHWTIPDVVIGFTIIFAAVKIHTRGVMKMMAKPAIRPGTIPRHSSSTEMYVIASSYLPRKLPLTFRCPGS